jgi:hypothetical protein
MIPTQLADRIEAYLNDAPGGGGHSDAAGADAWELLREAMEELRQLKPAPAPVSLDPADYFFSR